MFAVICIIAIEPATKKLPKTKYDITKVLKLPVNLQLTVLAILLTLLSITSLDPIPYESL